MLYSFLNLYPQGVRMYTPDTKMAVDFLFMDDVGTIIKIYKNAKPLSNKIISCHSTGAVLEVNAGDCDKYGIQIGDIAPIPLRQKHNMFQPLEIEDVNYGKIGNSVYAYSKNEYYMYSYKSHRWLHVDNNFKEHFIELQQITKRFTKEEKISENKANDFAINYDKQLLLDYRKYKKKYYQNGKYLIYEYNPELGTFKYYKLNSGWIGDKYNEINADKFLDLKEKSIILTKADADELIKKAENELSENKINQINDKNAEKYTDFTCNMFKYCSCFYKEDDTPGWLHSHMDGDKEICENRLKTLKKEKKIFDYKVYNGGSAIWKFKKTISFFLPSAAMTHLCSNWIIMPNENKMYLEDEIAKEPETKAEETKKLKIGIRQTKRLSFDPTDFESEKNIYSEASFSIRTDFQKIGQYIIIADNLISDISKFTKNLNKNNFAVLHNKEYMHFKLLAWKHPDSKIRFIMQDYSDYDVQTKIDTIVDKKILFECFKKLKKFFKILHAKNLKTYRQTYDN